MLSLALLVALAIVPVPAPDTAAAALALTVDSTTDAPDATPGDGTCDTGTGTCPLRAAIDEANASPGPDAISIEPGLATITIDIPGHDEDANATGDLDVTDDVVIEGNGATVDANSRDRVLHAHAGTTVELANLTLTGGRVTQPGPDGDVSGGGIHNDGDLTLTGVTVTENEVDAYLVPDPSSDSAFGGGIASRGTLGIEDSTISSNEVIRVGTIDSDYAWGGGIAAPWTVTGDTPAAQVTGSTITGNTVSSPTSRFDAAFGGGVGGSVTVTDSAIGANRVTSRRGEGGGVAGDVVHLTRTTLEENEVDAYEGLGGGVSAPALTVTGSEIARNEIVGAERGDGGGGLASRPGTESGLPDAYRALASSAPDVELTVTGSRITANSSGYRCGGVVVTGSATIEGTRIDTNTADTGPGGGVCAIEASETAEVSFVLRDSTVDGNTAAQLSGGVWVFAQALDPSQTGTIERSTISNNTAMNPEGTSSGGGLGLVLFNGPVDIAHSTFSGNVADTGGGIHVATASENPDPVARVRASTITANSAATGGGVASHPDFRATVELTGTIVANQATGADCSEVEVTSAGHNVDSDRTCDVTWWPDQPEVDPRLGPLRDNGGPTRTHQPLPGSPLIDAVRPGTADLCDAGTPTDQRGEPRRQGPACDIGAVEVPPPSSFNELWDSHRVSVNGDYQPIVGDFDCQDDGPEILWYAPGRAPDHLWGDVHVDASGQLTHTDRRLTINGHYEPLVVTYDHNGTDCRSDIFWYGPGRAPDHIWDLDTPGDFAYDSLRTTVNGTYDPVVVFQVNYIGIPTATKIYWHAPGRALDHLWSLRSGRITRYDDASQATGSYDPVAARVSYSGSDGILWYAPGTAPDHFWGGPLTNQPPLRNLQVTINGRYRARSLDGDVLLYAPGRAPDYLLTGIDPDSGALQTVPGRITGDYRPATSADGHTIVWHAPGGAPDHIWTRPSS